MKLPYFKFMVNDWISGDITLEDLQLQGIFVNICALVWKHDGRYSRIAKLSKRLGLPLAELNRAIEALIESDLVYRDEEGCLRVGFIDEQLGEVSQVHANKVLAGRLGALKRWGGKADKQTHDSRIADPSNKESESESEKESEKESDKEDGLAATYEEYPLFKKLHECPDLRRISLEQYLRAVQSRSKFMDLDKAIEEVVRRAHIQSPISKPGSFLDAQLSYWEKDHAADISKRRKAHKRLQRYIAEMAECIVEYRANPKHSMYSNGGIERMATEFAREHGDHALEMAEKMAGEAQF